MLLEISSDCQNREIVANTKKSAEETYLEILAYCTGPKGVDDPSTFADALARRLGLEYNLDPKCCAS